MEDILDKIKKIIPKEDKERAENLTAFQKQQSYKL